GFDFVTMQGSQANDQFRYEDGKVITNTNHCGGVLGGMTNGSPIVFRVAFKPTPSIFQPQDSVNLATGENEVLEIKGRHDPCAALRAVPVVEAAAAVALMDLMMD
ncbi:MAG: chorismate synthase, partial [Oscillospiraceae bacterium]|nr:chorismate synthase [Oscillospiraceae bacterium]